MTKPNVHFAHRAPCTAFDGLAKPLAVDVADTQPIGVARPAGAASHVGKQSHGQLTEVGLRDAQIAKLPVRGGIDPV